MSTLIRPVHVDDNLSRFDSGDDDLNQYVQSHGARFHGEGYPKTIVAVDKQLEGIVGLMFLNLLRPVDSSGIQAPVELGSLLVVDTLVIDKSHRDNGVALRLFQGVFQEFALLGRSLGLELLAVSPNDTWLRDELTDLGFTPTLLIPNGLAISWQRASSRYPPLLSPARPLRSSRGS